MKIKHDDFPTQRQRNHISSSRSSSRFWWKPRTIISCMTTVLSAPHGKIADTDNNGKASHITATKLPTLIVRLDMRKASAISSKHDTGRVTVEYSPSSKTQPSHKRNSNVLTGGSLLSVKKKMQRSSALSALPATLSPAKISGAGKPLLSHISKQASTIDYFPMNNDMDITGPVSDLSPTTPNENYWYPMAGATSPSTPTWANNLSPTTRIDDVKEKELQASESFNEPYFWSAMSINANGDHSKNQHDLVEAAWEVANSRIAGNANTCIITLPTSAISVPHYTGSLSDTGFEYLVELNRPLVNAIIQPISDSRPLHKIGTSKDSMGLFTLGFGQHARFISKAKWIVVFCGVTAESSWTSKAEDGRDTQVHVTCHLAILEKVGTRIENADYVSIDGPKGRYHVRLAARSTGRVSFMVPRRFHRYFLGSGSLFWPKWFSDWEKFLAGLADETQEEAEEKRWWQIWPIRMVEDIKESGKLAATPTRTISIAKDSGTLHSRESMQSEYYDDQHFEKLGKRLSATFNNRYKPVPITTHDDPISRIEQSLKSDDNSRTLVAASDTTMTVDGDPAEGLADPGSNGIPSRGQTRIVMAQDECVSVNTTVANDGNRILNRVSDTSGITLAGDLSSSYDAWSTVRSESEYLEPGEHPHSPGARIKGGDQGHIQMIRAPVKHLDSPPPLLNPVKFIQSASSELDGFFDDLSSLSSLSLSPTPISSNGSDSYPQTTCRTQNGNETVQLFWRLRLVMENAGVLFLDVFPPIFTEAVENGSGTHGVIHQLESDNSFVIKVFQFPGNTGSERKLRKVLREVACLWRLRDVPNVLTITSIVLGDPVNGFPQIAGIICPRYQQTLFKSLIPHIHVDREAGQDVASLNSSGIAISVPAKCRPELDVLYNVIVTLARVFEGIHRHGVYHLDIYPSNIMISSLESETSFEDTLRIVDFGSARIGKMLGLGFDLKDNLFDEDDYRIFAEKETEEQLEREWRKSNNTDDTRIFLRKDNGHSFYRSPELIFSKESIPRVDPSKVDMWSLGMVIHYLLTGATHIGEVLSEVDLRRLVNSSKTIEQHLKTNMAKSFIAWKEVLAKGLLVRDPTQRWSAGELVEWLVAKGPVQRLKEELRDMVRTQMDTRRGIRKIMNYTR